jgi:RimJ/RimL family protein N-acetyltransferase
LEPFTVSVPRIRTARLLLRELRVADFEAFAESYADPITQEHLGGPIDRRNAWRIFGLSVGSWILFGAGWWGLELVETGEVVGVVGAFYREKQADIELAWTIYRRFWKNGYASEAARAALAFAFDERKAPRAIAYIDAGNVASERVSERVGMRYEAEAELFGTPTRRFVVTAAHFVATRSVVSTPS